MAVDFSELEVTQRMRRDEVTVHKKSRKRTRLISSNLDHTREFIFSWLNH